MAKRSQMHEERQGKNTAVAVILFALVALFFLVTLVKLASLNA